MREETKAIFFCAGCVVTIEIASLLAGHNALVASSAIGAVTALGGYLFGRHRRVK